MENLEIKLEHSQKEKIKNREKRIRVIGRDKMYTHSPEEIIIEEEEKNRLHKSIQSTIDKFTTRRDKIFALHEQGYKNVEIAKMLGISRHIVGREVNKAEDELRNKLGGFNARSFYRTRPCKS